MDIKDMAGRHLVIGVHGTRVTPTLLKQFQRTRAGGLILFKRNIESPAQIRKMIGDLRRRLGRKILVMVDHEGGRVLRFTQGLTQFPAALSIGRKKDLRFVKRQGETEAAELRALGIDMNLAPVLDVLGKNTSPAVGDRSYGHDPGWVAKLGAVRIRAMQSSGLAACAKHFPGLGAATLDPHHELPRISCGLREFMEIHFQPFRAAIRAGVSAVMSTHVLCPKLDADKDSPATFSKKIILGQLRRKLRFRGLILTDDLEMGALRRFGSLGNVAVKAVEAGHDRLLICSDDGKQMEAFLALCRWYPYPPTQKTPALAGDGLLRRSSLRLRRLEMRRTDPPPPQRRRIPACHPAGALWRRSSAIRDGAKEGFASADSLPNRFAKGRTRPFSGEQAGADK